MAYGRTAGERILLNHESLWSRGDTPPVPDTAGHLPELREMLVAGRMAEAEHFFPALWRQAGFVAQPAHFLPGPDFWVETRPSFPFERYSAQLDLMSGEVATGWQENGYRVERRLFVSRTDGIAVLLLTTENPAGLDLRFSLAPHDSCDSEMYPDFGGVSAPEAEVSVEGNLLRIRAVFEDGAGYLAEALICDAPVAVDGSALRVRGGPAVTVLMRMSADGGPMPEWPDERNYDVLLGRHVPAHAALMKRVSFSLDGAEPATCERMLLDVFAGERSQALKTLLFQYGRYLLVSSSSGRACLPAHLQGLWNGDYRPAWTSGFFLNENLQMNYWPALAGNLAETMLPLFDLLESKMEDFRENAARMYGCRGILLPLFMSPRSGRKHNPQPHVVYWTAGAGWMAQQFYDYYLYTGDACFLRERALPFMREAALFYEDFFTEGADGCWVSAPSVSPENRPLGDFDSAGELWVSVDATMDFAVTKELFTHLVEAARHTGLHAGEIDRWRTFISKIPAYRINADGALAEWLDPRFRDNDHHRHLAHLYGLFPGREIGSGRQPELEAACRVAVDNRRVIGIQDQTGWSLAHLALMYARLGEGDQALECLRLLTRSCLGKNLFTYHNSDLDMGITQPLIQGLPAPFQMDANLGFTAAVLEMLVYSRPGMIRLLPALPTDWTQGELRGVCCHGRIQVDIDWQDGGCFLKLRLQSAIAQRLRVGLGMGAEVYSLELVGGREVRLVFVAGKLMQREEEVQHGV